MTVTKILLRQVLNLFVILSFSTAHAQVKTVENKDEEGTLWSKGTTLNGKKHGRWEYYYRNGNISHIAFYDQGAATGDWELYEMNGNMTNFGAYEEYEREEGLGDGIRARGKFVFFNGNTGSLKSSGYSKNQKREGLFKEYDKQGWIEKITIYEEGVKKKTFTKSEWDPEIPWSVAQKSVISNFERYGHAMLKDAEQAVAYSHPASYKDKQEALNAFKKNQEELGENADKLLFKVVDVSDVLKENDKMYARVDCEIYIIEKPEKPKSEMSEMERFIWIQSFQKVESKLGYGKTFMDPKDLTVYTYAESKSRYIAIMEDDGWKFLSYAQNDKADYELPKALVPLKILMSLGIPSQHLK